MMNRVVDEAGPGCAGVLIGGIGLFVLAPLTFILVRDWTGNETVAYRYLFAVVLVTMVIAGLALTRGQDPA